MFTVRVTDAVGNSTYKPMAIMVVTPPAMPGPGDILISEFRSEGVSAPLDFVELYNNTDFNFTVSTPDGSSGWALVNYIGAAYQLLYIPNGTVIKARSHYLGSERYASGIPTEAMVYAGLAGVNRPIGTQAWGYYDGYRIPNDTGLALFNTTNNLNWDVVHQLDAVGFTGNNALYREGLGLPHLGASTTGSDYAYVRRMGGLVADAKKRLAQ